MSKKKAALNIFMSWHDAIGKTIAKALRALLNEVFPDKLVIFMSDIDTKPGEQWFTKLSSELRKCDLGIVFITSGGTSAPWLNYEAGAIWMRGKDFFPILFGTKIPPEHPLRNLRYLEFSRGGIMELISTIYILIEKLQNTRRDHSYESSHDELLSAFLSAFQENHWERFKVQIKEILREFEDNPPPVKGINAEASKLLTDNGIDIHQTSIGHGIVTAIPGNKVHKVRRDLVQSAIENLTIVGSSLYEAFSLDRDFGSEQSRDISRVISQNLESRDDNSRFRLSVFLAEPRDFDVEYHTDNDDPALTGDSPLQRISSTMKILLQLARQYPGRLKLSICFVPLLQVDHIVQSGDLMIVRPTMLWTSDSEYKGTWLLCQKVVSADTSAAMYNAYSKWLELLRKESFEIPLDVTLTQEKPRKGTRTDRFHRKWREVIDDANRDGCRIEIRKLYRTQLISAAHATWGAEYRHYFPEIHVRSSEDVFRVRRTDCTKPSSECSIRERTELFNGKNLLGDGVQTALLYRLKKTQTLLDKLIKVYDKYGFAQIYPSFDLGLPNNVQRLAGGFATGILVLWRRGTPIIPIDTTVNACSSSFYFLTEEQFSDLRRKFARRANFFDQLIIEGNKASVLNSFSSGNHFIILGKSRKTQRYCLVLHASATEFKYKPLGLYPYPGVWYWNKIKVYPSRDGDNRYIRYLKDREAERFIQMALDLANSNKEDHDWFARELVGDRKAFPKSEGTADTQHFTKHHYYMPTSYTVAMGTYVEEPGSTVPMFSRPAKPIHLFKSGIEQPWTLRIENRDKCLIPHGWGQTVGCGTVDISIENTEQHKELIVNGERFPVAPRESLSERRNLGIRVREFEGELGGMSEFLSRGRHYFAGQIVDTFDQVACYQRGEVTIFEEMIDS